jgi:hypothetical protein
MPVCQALLGKVRSRASHAGTTKRSLVARKHLLQTAKQAVEIAIEQNETTALEYINSQTQESSS